MAPLIRRFAAPSPRGRGEGTPARPLIRRFAAPSPRRRGEGPPSRPLIRRCAAPAPRRRGEGPIGGPRVAVERAPRMLRKLLPALVLVAVALPAWPAARLTYQLSGVAVPVWWQASAFPLRYAIDRRIVSTKPDMESIIARAVAEWSAIADANVTFAPA